MFKTKQNIRGEKKTHQKETEKRGLDRVILQLERSVSIAFMVRKGCWE